MNPAPTEPRTCQCGCGQPINHLRANARYATNACRSRAWRHRTGYALQARRKPSQTRSRTRTPDLRISYRRALATLTETLGSPTRAHEILDPLLTDHQRQHLDHAA